MATCKNCGKPLILSGGKCIYCGADPNQDSSSAQEGTPIRKSRPIVQRKTFSTRDGQSPYSQYAGQSYIPGAKTDRYGNPQGSQYDLAKDGAFKGYKIVVICICPETEFTMNGKSTIMSDSAPALQRKGFDIKLFGAGESNNVQQIRSELDSDRCQLWLVSGPSCVLSSECLELVIDHFNRGRGLYVWSDNDPYYADSNVILNRLFRTGMSGNYWGDKVLSIQPGAGSPGIIKDHHITTGIQSFYEGITISNVTLKSDLKPLVLSSDGNVVTAFFDKDGKRALIDGGFTRLYYKWDSAGTDRFVVNCASWLTNIERFGYRPR